MSAMKDTTLHSAERLGAAIRLKRKEKGLSQDGLAGLVGVERKWVLRLEAGNAKAELGLILKTLQALGLRAYLTDEDRPPSRENRHASASRLDEVFSRLQPPARK